MKNVPWRIVIIPAIGLALSAMALEGCGHSGSHQQPRSDDPEISTVNAKGAPIGLNTAAVAALPSSWKRVSPLGGASVMMPGTPQHSYGPDWWVCSSNGCIYEFGYRDVDTATKAAKDVTYNSNAISYEGHPGGDRTIDEGETSVITTLERKVAVGCRIYSLTIAVKKKQNMRFFDSGGFRHYVSWFTPSQPPPEANGFFSSLKIQRGFVVPIQPHDTIP